MTALHPVVAVASHRRQGVRYFPGQMYCASRAWEWYAELRGWVFRPGRVATDWWGAPGRVLGAEALPSPEPVFSREPAPGSLRILQGVGYDPGNAAYRFHSALNECTHHASMFARWGDTNPSCSLRQYDGDRDRGLLRQAMLEADVVHCHVDYLVVGNLGLEPRGLKVIHYHGSRPDGAGFVNPHRDAVEGALQVGARLSHVAESPDVHWLPIAVPVERYRAMRTAAGWPLPAPGRRFRVAHSPTKREWKGTDVFLDACTRLCVRGVPIEPVLIEGLSHRQALELKATCHAVFDAFWLGLQGSGLEGGAMGLPVIAGDADVAELYRRHVGAVPYTFAHSSERLAFVLERLAMDQDFYYAEAARVRRYVEAYHDYPAVARRYEGILAMALGRPDIPTPALAPERQAREVALV